MDLPALPGPGLGGLSLRECWADRANHVLDGISCKQPSYDRSGLCRLHCVEILGRPSQETVA